MILLRQAYNIIGDLSIDFSFVGVSGMDDSSLLTGRPFGGCSILYRKTLLPCVTPLSTHSKRFCAIRMSDPSGSSTLLICVYLPSKSITSCYNEYINTLGEIEGFVGSQEYDHIVVAGDFNV